ncbi:cell division protein ZipA [Thioalkalivibrio nitratireducens]|uniref:cell division protein ZipA n=1 Tax=Thioalkalivibrio nitratireducens TaxID=186931 RepID=UPI003AAC810C
MIIGVILVAGIWIAHRLRTHGPRQVSGDDADDWGDEGTVHIRAHRNGHEIEPTLGGSGEDFERLLESEPGDRTSRPAALGVEPEPWPDAPGAEQVPAPPVRPAAERDLRPPGAAGEPKPPQARPEPEPRAGRVATTGSALLARLRQGLNTLGDLAEAKAPPAAAPSEEERTARPPERRWASPYEDVSEPRVVGRNPLAREQDREKILVLHVVAPRNRPFTGVALGAALRRAGLALGEMSIYHYRDEASSPDSAPLFSVANMVAPGTLTDDDIASMMTPGITLFLQLHACDQPHRAFEALLETSHVLARDLGGSILDAQQSTATNQTLAHMREEMNQWLLRHRPDVLRRKADR